MRPLALLLALSLPAAAAEYNPPAPNPAGCRRALDLLDTLAGIEPLNLGPNLGYHVSETGPDKGVFVARERAGTASYAPFPEKPEGLVSFEVRREDGTPVYVQFRFEQGRYRAAVAGANPFPRSRLVDAPYDAPTMARMTRARLADSIAVHARAHRRAREIDDRSRLPLEESGRVLTCPRDAWAAVINLCRGPENAQLMNVLAAEYCKDNVCGRGPGPERVHYVSTARCERDVRGKGDRLDRHEPR